MYIDPTSNPDGLRVMNGGSNLELWILYGGLYAGVYPATIEVYRGYEKYDYDPVTLIFESFCDGDITTSTLSLTVSYIRSCAQAQFHKSFTTFHVTSDLFVHHACC